MTLKTLADVRKLIGHIPKEQRHRSGAYDLGKPNGHIRDALGLLMRAIERIEGALELVDNTAHQMSGIQNELPRKAEACRRLAVGAEDEWRKALWIQRARHGN